MSEKYKVILDDQPHFITLTVVDWVDLFIRPVYTQILDDSFRYCIRFKGLLIHAYVYMTSHLHLIVSSQQEDIHTIDQTINLQVFLHYYSEKLKETGKL